MLLAIVTVAPLLLTKIAPPALLSSAVFSEMVLPLIVTDPESTTIAPPGADVFPDSVLPVIVSVPSL